MSDIHGNYKKYRRMLDAIKFCDRDVLYILGDVIDRGPDGLRILRDMCMRSNIIPILGNHEYMASISLPILMKEITEDSISEMTSNPEEIQYITEWIHVGGAVTIDEFAKLNQESRKNILDYINEFELYRVVKINGKTFVLVHAGFANFITDRKLNDYDLSELIFQPSDYSRKYFTDVYLVTGHTPTQVIYEMIDGIKDCQLTFERNNHIAVDCGCGFGGKLGCICLETMEKFYVD
jgi:serine/threonine protein phosphatase 1